MKTYLYIGRYQPMTRNHVRLIQQGLDDGGNVVIGIRVTKINERNPFSYEARQKMLYSKFADKVSYIAVPDPDCDLVVRVGRKVGYEVQYLEEETEEYLAAGKGSSATKVRKKMRQEGTLADKELKGIVVWITGGSGSGKKTVAAKLAPFLNAIILDGPAMRYAMSPDLGFTPEDREAHNFKVARLCKVMADQGCNVVVPIIAPFQKTRRAISEIVNCVWAYVKRDLPNSVTKGIYEIPVKPDVSIDSDKQTPIEEAMVILKYIQGRYLDADTD